MEREAPESTKIARSISPILGAVVEGTETHFGLFTTTADRCSVRLFSSDGYVLSSHPLEMREHGYFSTTIAGAPHGTRYKFVLNDRELPDPYARFLPDGVHGAAMVMESRYVWRGGPGVARPLEEQVFYELHVGTFTEAGTYNAARAQLPDLVALGITTVELMPVSAFPGSRGWGYDGVAHFAPFAPYGTPGELRNFIDEAHSLGLSVFLDVVYNHFGPSGNYLPSYSPGYFSTEIRNAWGAAPDFAYVPMRRYVLDNARYWLDEFRFDGLRLDATSAIIDSSSQPILRVLAEEVAALRPRKILIAEDERNDPTLVTSDGLDGIWADDFHHALRVTLTGERDGYYANYEPGAATVAKTLQQGWFYDGQTYPATGKRRGHPAEELSASAFVYCIQNHDQVGNRALGQRLSDDISLDAYCMASMLLLFLPMTPMLFMGQEWASSSPFLYFTDHEPELGALVSAGRRAEFQGFAAFDDPAGQEKIPDPQAFETFGRSGLRWAERRSPASQRVLALYQDMLTRRRTDDVLRDASRARLRSEALGDVLLVERCHGSSARRLVVNLSANPQTIESALTGWNNSRKLRTSGENDDGFDGKTLPPWTAVLLTGELGVSG